MILLKHFFLKIRQIKRIDFTVLLGVIILSLYGIFNIFNATNFNSAKRQLLFLIISLIILSLILFIDYSSIKQFIPLFYYSNVILLVFTKIFSEKINGANGWIQVGNFTLQPSEFMKISIILMLAKIIDDNEGKINDKSVILKLFYYIIMPLLAIVIQPDMGMTLVCFIMSMGVLFIAGLNIKFYLSGILISIFSILLVWDTNILPQYWKNRLVYFLDPSADSLGNGLQVLQSKIGVGSGGFWGKHSVLIGNSDNSYVSQFVPEPQNDFIFSIIGEYWGFIGSIVLLLIFLIIILRIVKVARNAKDIFGELFCVGMIFYMLYAVFQNIGMTIGLLPVTGINLPFVSYGGSSMLSNMIGISIILNINMHRDPIVFNT